MDRESSMGTSDIQCNEKEHDTPSDFASESQIPPFFTQIELDILWSTKKEEEKKHPKDNKDHAFLQRKMDVSPTHD